MMVSVFSERQSILVKKLLYYSASSFLSAHWRSSHWRCSARKGVLGNFVKFLGKHPCQSLFFNKVAACNFIKKETLAQVFSCEFCVISKNTFSTEHLWPTASHIDFVIVIFLLIFNFYHFKSTFQLLLLVYFFIFCFGSLANWIR